MFKTLYLIIAVNLLYRIFYELYRPLKEWQSSAEKIKRSNKVTEVAVKLYIYIRTITTEQNNIVYIIALVTLTII